MDFLAATGSRSVAGAHTRVHSPLIVVESALVVVLLASAGLFLRSYINVESFDTGFSSSTVSHARRAASVDPMQALRTE